MVDSAIGSQHIRFVRDDTQLLLHKSRITYKLKHYLTALRLADSCLPLQR